MAVLQMKIQIRGNKFKHRDAHHRLQCVVECATQTEYVSRPFQDKGAKGKGVKHTHECTYSTAHGTVCKNVHSIMERNKQ